jgi:hypothetical protein
MITFLIAIAAGFATPFFENLVGDRIVARLTKHLVVQPGEPTLISFVLSMLIAGLLVMAFVGGGSPFWFVLGGLLGVFGTRIVGLIRTKIAERGED